MLFPEEKHLINSDANEPSWAILGYRAYIGPDTELGKIRVLAWKIKKIMELYKLD